MTSRSRFIILQESNMEHGNNDSKNGNEILSNIENTESEPTIGLTAQWEVTI